MRLVLCCVLAVVLAGTPACRSASSQDPARAETVARLDSLSQAFVSNGEAPGLAIFVLRGADTLLLRGYGYANLEDSVPVTPRSVFRIGSLTKQFTAAAVMQLVEERRIALDDAIQRFLPSYLTHGHRVTIRHLLTHTSGIPSYTSLDQHDVNRAMPADSLIAVFSQEPFDFAPGGEYRYNNSGYFLLGLILEQVMEQPYNQIVETRLAAPLGLTDTRYAFVEPIIPRRAAGYEPEGGAFANAEYNAMTQPFAAGGLCSTVQDLVTWTRALFSGDVVQPATLDAMTTPARLNDGSAIRYGYGLVIGDLEGHRRIWHGGSINGFTAALDHFPDDDLTVAILVNSPGGNMGRLVGAVTRAALGLR
jgi:CubicO group peptidase (beta-lactamase class C family)